VDELKIMLRAIVQEVLSDNSNRHVALTEEKKTARGSKAAGIKGMAKASVKSTRPVKRLTENDGMTGKPCPLCQKGHIIKGKTAYGCSEWQNGCTFRLPFSKE